MTKSAGEMGEPGDILSSYDKVREIKTRDIPFGQVTYTLYQTRGVKGLINPQYFIHETFRAVYSRYKVKYSTFERLRIVHLAGTDEPNEDKIKEILEWLEYVENRDF